MVSCGFSAIPCDRVDKIPGRHGQSFKHLDMVCDWLDGGDMNAEYPNTTMLNQLNYLSSVEALAAQGGLRQIVPIVRILGPLVILWHSCLRHEWRGM